MPLIFFKFSAAPCIHCRRTAQRRDATRRDDTKPANTSHRVVATIHFGGALVNSLALRRRSDVGGEARGQRAAVEWLAGRAINLKPPEITPFPNSAAAARVCTCYEMVADVARPPQSAVRCRQTVCLVGAACCATTMGRYGHR